MYLIEGTTNQTNQENINSLLENSNPKLFLINSTIRNLHTNTAPKNPATTIVFGTHWHTPATKTIYYT